MYIYFKKRKRRESVTHVELDNRSLFRTHTRSARKFFGNSLTFLQKKKRETISTIDYRCQMIYAITKHFVNLNFTLHMPRGKRIKQNLCYGRLGAFPVYPENEISHDLNSKRKFRLQSDFAEVYSSCIYCSLPFLPLPSLTITTSYFARVAPNDCAIVLALSLRGNALINMTLFCAPLRK